MDEPDPIDAIVNLMSLVDELTIGGPDEDGLVWATGGSSEADTITFPLGRVGTLPADAALRWRSEQAATGGAPGRKGVGTE